MKIVKFWSLLKFLILLLLSDRHLMKSLHISLLESQGDISSHFSLKIFFLMDNSEDRKCMKKKMKIYLRYILIYFYLIFLIYKNEAGNMLCILCLNFSWEFFCANYFLKNLFIVTIFQYMEITFHSFLSSKHLDCL